PHRPGAVHPRRKEDDLASPDQILSGTNPPPSLPCRHAAIDGIIAIVAHHEIGMWRHIEWANIVELTPPLPVQHKVLCPAWKRLEQPRLPLGFFWADIGTGRRLRSGLAIDVDDAAAHFDMVTRQTDQPFHVVQRGVTRQLEHDDVTALGLAAENAPLEGNEVQRKAVLPVTIGELRDEKVIAYQQRIL